MTQQIIQLQNHITAVLPLLEANLNAAHNEWMEGKVAKGAYEYCLNRHSLAIELVNLDDSELNEEEAFKLGAALFIDLRTAMKDVPVERKADEQKNVDALMSLYVQNGFTEKHPFLDIPVRPKVN